MLNQAISGLGNSFMQNRAMAQRANEAEMERDLKERMLEEQIQGRKDVATQTNAVREDNAKARQQHFDAEMQHWKNMETAAQGSSDAKVQQLQQRAKEFAHKSWDNSVKWFSDQVKDGLMDASQAQTGLTKAYGNLPDQTKQILADNPSVMALQSGDIDWKNPPTKADSSPAAVKTMKAIQDMESQADDVEDDDPDQAQYLRDNANILRSSLQRRPPPGLRKSVTTKDPRTGSQQTVSGPAGDVDAAIGGGGPAPAAVGPGATTPGAATSAQATLKFVRDKSGKLVPQMPFQPPIQPPAGVDPSYGNLSNGLQIPPMR